MFLLDTNVLSELRRPDRADRNVAIWANALPADNPRSPMRAILMTSFMMSLLTARSPAACLQTTPGSVGSQIF